MPLVIFSFNSVHVFNSNKIICCEKRWGVEKEKGI